MPVLLSGPLVLETLAEHDERAPSMKPLVSEVFQQGEPVHELPAQFTRHCNLRKAFDSMGGLPVIGPQPYTWEPLNAEGQLAQTALRRQYLSFASFRWVAIYNLS